MTSLDWLIVIGLNGSIVAYGFYLSRGVHSTTDWFLAGRGLPWWLVGLSMYATAIDASDLVADSGATYTLGMSVFVANWVGVTAGWVLAAYFVFKPMYRMGMYTNAEYLEARFSPGVRVLCAFVQVQYRTMVLAIIGTTMFLTLSIVSGVSEGAAWGMVGAIAVLAAVYTAFGGLRSVAVTDSLQFVVMSVAALVIWVFVWGQVGGWQGAEQRLAAVDAELPAQLLHVGYGNLDLKDVSGQTAEEIERLLLLGGQYNAADATITKFTPAWIVALAFIIIGLAYSIVNHTQAMRMFAAKSEWDMKMSVFVAGAVLLVMTFFNLSMGIMGRALFPEQAALPQGRQDAIYPYLVSQIEAVGLKGLVVAGILAAALSTYDSIGSSLSALLTRDVYARLIVRDGDDHHYLRVGQWLTPAVIAVSFFYVPFMLEGGMFLFYVDLTSTFVIPLLTIFLLGTCTRVHRRSGMIALLAGALYGIVRLVAPYLAENYGVVVLPAFMVNSYAAYIISMLVTAGTAVLISLFVGWEDLSAILHEEEGEWLRSSQQAVRQLEDTSMGQEQGARSARIPLFLSLGIVAVGCFLAFVVFW